jgi:hypothetical protein
MVFTALDLFDLTLSWILEIPAMVYLIGFVSFVIGFLAGQLLLARLLRDRSNDELRKDKSLMIYGILNWLVAILFAVSGVSFYRMFGG